MADNTVLEFLDQFLEISHRLFLAFLVFGWMWRQSRRMHRWALSLTAINWFVIGPVLFSSVGFCIISEIQRQVRMRISGPCDVGPDKGFVEYLLEDFGISASIDTINAVVLTLFFITSVITIWLWEMENRGQFREKARSQTL